MVLSFHHPFKYLYVFEGLNKLVHWVKTLSTENSTWKAPFFLWKMFKIQIKVCLLGLKLEKNTEICLIYILKSYVNQMWKEEIKPILGIYFSITNTLF